MKLNPYKTLGVKESATFIEIKSAYRELVKKHHPDAGGDEEKILSVNAAWEILSDIEKRKAYDIQIKVDNSLLEEKAGRDFRNAQASNVVRSVQGKVAEEENELNSWIKNIYTPINKLLAQIINSFPKKLRELSADPYDDLLMESFCEYLTKSQHKIHKIHHLYQQNSAPLSGRELSLSLYHCFSQVQDALNEFELYTNGYVDNYLHDGNEMLREARKKRQQLQEIKRGLQIH